MLVVWGRHAPPPSPKKGAATGKEANIRTPVFPKRTPSPTDWMV
jgi:hypothetical protein